MYFVFLVISGFPQLKKLKKTDINLNIYTKKKTKNEKSIGQFMHVALGHSQRQTHSHAELVLVYLRLLAKNKKSGQKL